MSIAEQLALIPTEIDRLEAAKADLVAAIIGKGVNVPADTLFSSLDTYVAQIKTGADVSGVTTAAADVLAGKKFVDANGVLQDGTMPSKDAATYTPGTSNQIIAARQYLAGAQTIAGDANLVAANIVKGKTIFGVAGSAETAGTESVVTGLTSDLTSGTSATISGLSFSKVKTVILAKGSATTSRYWTLAYFLHNGAGQGRMYHSPGSGINTDITNICSFTYSNGTLTINTTQTGTGNMVGIHRYFIIGE